MAGSFSNFLENAFLNHAFRGTAYTAPTSLYVALYTVAPSDSGGGTEVSGGSYARAGPLTPSSTFSTATTGSTTTTATITFPTATGTWGTVVAFAIFDNASNFIAWGDLSVSKTITSGTPFLSLLAL